MQTHNTLTANRKIHVLLICSANASRCLCDIVFPGIEDCAVSKSANTEHALNLFANYLRISWPFDIVFLDYLLYRSNGITLAKKLRVLYPQVKLEFFSSLFFKDKNIRAAYTELFGCFKKPVRDNEQLVNIINTIRVQKKPTGKNYMQNTDPEWLKNSGNSPGYTWNPV